MTATQIPSPRSGQFSSKDSGKIAPEYRRNGSSRGNFEMLAWLFMRLSGVVLVVLVIGHLLIQLVLDGGVSKIGFAFVAGRWAWTVSSSQTPGPGGSQVISDIIPRISPGEHDMPCVHPPFTELRELLVGIPEVEVVGLPFAWGTRTQLLKSAMAWRMIDLTAAGGKRIDLVIATRFPLGDTRGH